MAAIAQMHMSRGSRFCDDRLTMTIAGHKILWKYAFLLRPTRAMITIAEAWDCAAASLDFSNCKLCRSINRVVVQHFRYIFIYGIVLQICSQTN